MAFTGGRSASKVRLRPAQGSLCLGLRLVAFTAVSATTGCGALLDLDVQYKDGGAADDGPASTDGAEGGSRDAGGSGGETGDGPGADGPSARIDATTPGDAPDAPLTADASLGDASTTEASPPGRAPYYVQSNYGATDGVHVGASATLNDPVGEGSTIVVGVEFDSDNNLTIGDSLGGNWQRAGFLPLADLSGTRTEVWYAIGVHAGAETVNATFQGEAAADYVELYVHEYAGISAVDATAVGNGNMAGAMSTSAMMTTAANDLLFAFADTTSAGTPGSGFTGHLTNNSDLTEDRIVAQPSSVAGTAVIAGGQWAIVGVAFKPF